MKLKHHRLSFGIPRNILELGTRWVIIELTNQSQWDRGQIISLCESANNDIDNPSVSVSLPQKFVESVIDFMYMNNEVIEMMMNPEYTLIDQPNVRERANALTPSSAPSLDTIKIIKK